MSEPNVRYPVFKNEGRRALEAMYARAGKHIEVRGLLDEKGNLYFWAAYAAVHVTMTRALGLDDPIHLTLYPNMVAVSNRRSVGGPVSDERVAKVQHNRALQRIYGASFQVKQMADLYESAALFSQFDIDYEGIMEVLELHGEDIADDDIAQMWYDSRMAVFRRMKSLEAVPVYRHMNVEVEDFLAHYEERGVGYHWSIDPGISSPAFEHGGSDSVMLYGEIDPSQIDWNDTLRQQFAHPAEAEVIFQGGVFLRAIETDDGTIEVKRQVKRD